MGMDAIEVQKIVVVSVVALIMLLSFGAPFFLSSED